MAEMACDYCPTKNQPGPWASLIRTTGTTRSVAVLCPDCLGAAQSTLTARSEKAAKDEERHRNVARAAAQMHDAVEDAQPGCTHLFDQGDFVFTLTRKEGRE